MQTAMRAARLSEKLTRFAGSSLARGVCRSVVCAGQPVPPTPRSPVRRVSRPRSRVRRVSRPPPHSCVRRVSRPPCVPPSRPWPLLQHLCLPPRAPVRLRGWLSRHRVLLARGGGWRGPASGVDAGGTWGRADRPPASRPLRGAPTALAPRPRGGRLGSASAPPCSPPAAPVPRAHVSPARAPEAQVLPCESHASLGSSLPVELAEPSGCPGRPVAQRRPPDPGVRVDLLVAVPWPSASGRRASGGPSLRDVAQTSRALQLRPGVRGLGGGRPPPPAM